MTPASAGAILRRIQPPTPNIISEVRITDDMAGMHLSVQSNPERWCWVSTSGDNWIRLGVDGGYANLSFNDEASDGQVESALQDLVDLAVLYLTKPPKVTYFGRWRFPGIEVQGVRSSITLRRTVVEDWKNLLGGSRYKH